MWSQGSKITQVSNPRGASRNLHFTREQLFKSLDKSSKKLRALQSFCITCLPTINVIKEIETFKYTESAVCIEFLESHPELHILVWFCVQLDFQFSLGLNQWAKEISAKLDVKVNGGHYRPETSLKKVSDMISRMPAWKAAGLSSDYLSKTAIATKNFLAFRIAKGLNPKLKVTIRPYTLLIFLMPVAETADMDGFYQECSTFIASKTELIGPSLCYYPLGWKLDAWQDFVDKKLYPHLPTVPQFDSLEDPYQGVSRATQKGVTKGIETTTPQVTQQKSSQPAKNKTPHSAQSPKLPPLKTQLIPETPQPALSSKVDPPISPIDVDVLLPQKRKADDMLVGQDFSEVKRTPSIPSEPVAEGKETDDDEIGADEIDEEEEISNAPGVTAVIMNEKGVPKSVVEEMTVEQAEQVDPPWKKFRLTYRNENDAGSTAAGSTDPDSTDAGSTEAGTHDAGSEELRGWTGRLRGRSRSASTGPGNQSK
jgi:hypothetical protein